MGAIKSLINVVLYEPLYNVLVLLVIFTPGHSVGVAIILITIIIRIILYPSTKKSLIAQKKIRKLQPKLEEIKKTYKGDPQAQNKALMELYKTEKVNPLGSCLPLLIQLPIFFVLYRVFYNYSLHGFDSNSLYSFVAKPEFVNTYFFGIDLAQKEFWILPIVTGLLQFWQSKQLMPKTSANSKDDPSAMITKQMTYFFPIIIFITARSFPAALPLYWSANSLFSIVQQWWILRENTEDLEEKLEQLDSPLGVEKSKKVEYAKGKDVTVTIRKRNK